MKKWMMMLVVFLVVGSMLVVAANPPKGVESEIVTEEGRIISYEATRLDNKYHYYGRVATGEFNYAYDPKTKSLYLYDISKNDYVKVTNNNNLVRAFSDGLNSKRKVALESARRLGERIDCTWCRSNQDILTELAKYDGKLEDTEILKRMYTKIYPGRNLVSEVKGDLSGGDETKAVAILSPPAVPAKSKNTDKPSTWNNIPVTEVEDKSYEWIKNKLRSTIVGTNLELLKDEIGQSAAENLVKLAVRKGEGTIIAIDEYDTGLLDITGIGVKYYDAATLKELERDNRATDIIRSQYLKKAGIKIADLDDIRDDANFYSKFQNSIEVDKAIDLRLSNSEFRSKLALKIVTDNYVDTGIIRSDDNPTFLFYKRKSDNSFEKSMISYEQVADKFPLSKQEFRDLFSGHTDYNLEDARLVVQSYRRWVKNRENTDKQTSDFWNSEAAKKIHQATDKAKLSQPRKGLSKEPLEYVATPSPAPSAADAKPIRIERISITLPPPLKIEEIAEPGELTVKQVDVVSNKILREGEIISEFLESIEEKGYYHDPMSGATIFRTEGGKIKVYYVGGKVLKLTDDQKFSIVSNPVDLNHKSLLPPNVYENLGETREYIGSDNHYYQLLDDGTITKRETTNYGEPISFQDNRNTPISGEEKTKVLRLKPGDSYTSLNGDIYRLEEDANGRFNVILIRSSTTSHLLPGIDQVIPGEPSTGVVKLVPDDRVLGIVRYRDGSWEELSSGSRWIGITDEKQLNRLYQINSDVTVFQFEDSDKYVYRQLRSGFKSGKWERKAKDSNEWEVFDNPATIQRLELLRGTEDLIVLQGLIIKQPLSAQQLAAQQILNLQGLRKTYDQYQADAEQLNQEGDELFNNYLKAEKTEDKQKYLEQAQAKWNKAITEQKNAAVLARKEDLRKTDSIALIEEDLQTFARGGRSAEVAALQAELKKAEDKKDVAEIDRIKGDIDKAKTSQKEITHSEAYDRFVGLSNRILNDLGSDVVTQLRLTANFKAERDALDAELNAAGEGKDQATVDKKAEIASRIAKLTKRQSVDLDKLKVELDKKCPLQKDCLSPELAREMLKESDTAMDKAQKVKWQGDWMQNIILKLGGSSTVYNALVNGDYIAGDLISGVSGLLSKVGSYQALSNLLIPDLTKEWQKNANSEFIQRFANFDAFMAEAYCLDDDDLRSEQPGQSFAYIRTRGGTFQHVAALSAERSGDDEKLFVACTRNEETEKLGCRSGEGNEEDQICKNGFCYANRDAKEPVKGLFYKISWGVTAPADDSFTPYVDEAGNAMKFNIGLKKKGFSTWLYESDEAFGKNVIVLANGESDKDTLAFYSDINYEEVCIAIQDGYRPISHHGGPTEGFKPVEDICKPFIKLQGKEVDFLASNKVTSSKSPSKGNVKRNRQI